MDARFGRTLWAWAVLPLWMPGQEEGGTPVFEDPAPPQVVELEPMEAPPARDTEGLRRHADAQPLAPTAVVEDWPGFLGPRRDAHSREAPLLASWPEGGPRLVWELAVGEGFSSPVVQGERLVYTHRVGDEEVIDCLEASTGRRHWRVSSPCDYRGQYIGDGGPRATPLIVGDHVYVHGVQGILQCLELGTGRALWRRNVSREYGISDQFFGVVSSPVAHGDLLIQNIGAPPPAGPSVVAFELATGRARWGAGRRWGPSCASPVIVPTGAGGTRLRAFVITGGKARPPTGGLMVIDPNNGAVEFEYPFRSRTYESVNGASPVLGPGQVLLSASYGLGSAAIQFDGQGRFSERWKDRHVGFEFATPVYEDGVYYAIDGVSGRTGSLIALDPDSGEELSRTSLDWEDAIEVDGVDKTVAGSVGQGSLMVCDDALLCLGDGGDLLRLEATPEGARILSRVSLFRSSENWTPLVLSHGLLYVCQNTRDRYTGVGPRLLCYDLRGEG